VSVRVGGRDVYPAHGISNVALEQTACSYTLAAAAQRRRKNRRTSAFSRRAASVASRAAVVARAAE